MFRIHLIPGAVALSAALLAAPALADCGDVAAMEDAGVVTEVKRSPLPAKSCVDGSIERLEPTAAMGQAAKRIPSGGYVLPGLNYRVSAAHVEVSGQATKARTCRDNQLAFGESNLGVGLGHGGCGD